MANTTSPAARHRWAAFPVADSSRVALMYPPMSRGTIISPWTRPKGSLGGNGTGAYCCTVSFCPAALAASSNRSARTAGARSLMDGTTISVLEVPEGISAPQIVVWLIAFLTACSFGYWVTLREMFFSAAVRIGEDPVVPNGRLVALGACSALI